MAQQAAASESLLMTLYDVRLPQINMSSTDSSTQGHQPSIALLQTFSAWLLTRYTPVTVVGDGNCFFRSVSYALYGTESMHWLLRLLCVNEVLANRPMYDKSHEEFYAPFKADACLPLPDYVEFVSELSKPNSYCDMLAVLAVLTSTILFHLLSVYQNQTLLLNARCFVIQLKMCLPVIWGLIVRIMSHIMISHLLLPVFTCFRNTIVCRQVFVIF